MNISKNPIIISFVVIITSFVISYYHALYTGDTVADYVGYFVSMAIVPSFFGGAIGYSALLIINTDVNKNIKKYLWLPAIGVVTSLVPTLIFIIGMSLPNH